MIGRVDEFGRAMISISIRAGMLPARDIEVWIDTGFNGDLVLPATTINQLALTSSGTVKAILADGSEVALQTYSCEIEWFGEVRHLEVVANSGVYPLLGVGLLLDHDLRISYRTGELELE